MACTAFTAIPRSCRNLREIALVFVNFREIAGICVISRNFALNCVKLHIEFTTSVGGRIHRPAGHRSSFRSRMRPPPRDAMADRKGGLAPGCSVPGLNLIQRVGCLSPFPDSHPSKAHHLKIGGIPAAAYVAPRLRIAGNDGAVHADLLGDLLLGDSGVVRLPAPSSPFDRSRGVWDLGSIFLPPVLL